MVAVIPRSEWGARHEDGGGPATVPFSEWWLHHSVTIAPDLVPPFGDEHAAMRTLEDIGEQRFGRGISYTWPIMPNGRVYVGHSVNRLGAHTGGRNSAARAICFVGNYEVARLTAAQIESAAQLMVQEYRAKRAKTFQLNGGHRDLKATSCPGRFAYEAIPLINARARAIAAGAPPMQEDDMTPDELLNYPAYVGGPSISQALKDLHHRTRDVTRSGADGKPVAVPMLQEIADAKTALDKALPVLLDIQKQLAALSGGGGAVDVKAVADQLTVVPKT